MIILTGKSGSGKTTLVQHLNGLVKATEGRIVVDGLDLTEKGRAMKRQAEEVPESMQGCIPLEEEELLTLKRLLCKAVERMHSEQV